MNTKIAFYLLPLLLSLSVLTQAQVPGTLSYQGILLQNDGITPLADGAHAIVFNFYNVSSGGAALFTRSISVTTGKGLYTCILGDGTAGNAALPSSVGTQQIYIGITVDGSAELAPRDQLTTSPYAVQAQSAYTVTTNANLTGDVTSVGNATTITNLPDSKLAAISTPGKVSNSATSATNANTVSTIVARDAGGNFSAGTITAALNGNAASATSVTTNANLTGPVTSIGNATTISAGAIVDANINASGITTAGKVSGNAITSGTIGGSTIINTIGTITGASFSGNGSALTALNAGNISGTTAIANGGTGASTATAARTNLGLGSLSTLSTVTTAEITDGTIADVDINAAGITTAGKVSGNAIISGTIGGSTIINTTGTIAGASFSGNGSALTSLSAANISGTTAVANGGTGASTAAVARTNLGLGSLSTLSTVTTSEITDGTIADIDINPSGITTAGKVSGNAVTSGTIAGSTSINTTGTITSGAISGSAASISGAAVYGTNSGVGGVGGYGVWGNTTANGSNYGVYGTAPTAGGIGVYGNTNNVTGLTGVYGISTSGHGIYGKSLTAGKAGGYGINDIAGGYGLFGTSGAGIGVYGNTTTGYAGIFTGGNVGIGTATPSQALQVSGQVLATSFSGDGSAIVNINSIGITDGTIVNADINAGAAITDAKLATINTAGKVSGGAITSGTIGGSTIINTTGSINSGAIIATSFSGNGSLVTNITSNGITDGTIVDADINATGITTAGKVSGNAITSGTIGGSTNINTTGTITIPSANEYSYSGSKTHYYSVGAAAFQLYAASGLVVGTAGSSSTNFRSLSSEPALKDKSLFAIQVNGFLAVAPVNLPDGATITQVTASVSMDATDGSSIMGVRLVRIPWGSTVPSTMATANATVGDVFGEVISTSSITNPVIDNANFNYQLVGFNDFFGYLLCAKIAYAVSKAD